MPVHSATETDEAAIPAALRRFLQNRIYEFGALAITAIVVVIGLSLASWSAADPSLNHATGTKAQNMLGGFGAVISAELIQFFGLGVLFFAFAPLSWAAKLFRHERVEGLKMLAIYWIAATLALCALLGIFPKPQTWALATGLGGYFGEIIASIGLSLLAILITGTFAKLIFGAASLFVCWLLLPRALDLDLGFLKAWLFYLIKKPVHLTTQTISVAKPKLYRFLNKLFEEKAPAATLPRTVEVKEAGGEIDPLANFAPLSLRKKVVVEEVDEALVAEEEDVELEDDDAPFDEEDEELEQKPIAKAPPKIISHAINKPKPKTKFVLPELGLLAEPKRIGRMPELSKEQLLENAKRLEGVLEDFGVRGSIINVRPGPVVTLYELEPAPGIKSSRVISLADDIARSMSAVSARVAVVSGRNAIGIELPNPKRETVFLREMFQGDSFIKNNTNLTLALGKNIGGEPIFADLAKMPHLLIAGTTGSGKSVGINTMILSLLYRLTPDKCKLIMIDPKMLELSVYEGIPHLLAPVVTDPRKAVVALKWAVREMEERYKKMSKCGVRNVDGYNAKVAQILAKGDKMTRTVQTGFEAESGDPIFEEQELDLTPLPYIVVIIDEMADLMMVAGKDIEGAVQRLAQMARAAGIHVVMATQRPSVDVITGTIKANFPTRISFQVTSKIDSRTILGEQGAEQLLGQGDMLYMAGGGRISRLHAPFVSDGEVEAIVNHLKLQGAPEYLEAVTEEVEVSEGGEGGFAGGESSSGDDLYDQAVQVVLRDKKVSTSYVQRRLGVGYNKAATLIERMEQEGVISAPNSQGKREILVPGESAR